MPCCSPRTDLYTWTSQKRQGLLETMRRTFLQYPSVPFACSVCSRYIGALHTYLTSFMRRTQPLVDIDSKETAAIEEFEKKWEANELEGWTDASPKAQADGSEEGIWCTACKYSIVSLRVLFYPFARPKDVLQTDRVRCPSHLKKAHQSYLTASYVRPTSGQSEWSPFYVYSLSECRAIQE